MKTQLQFVVPTVAAILLGGCASGGGGGNTALDAINCIGSAGLACGQQKAKSSSTTGTSPSTAATFDTQTQLEPATFSSWATLETTRSTAIFGDATTSEYQEASSGLISGITRTGGGVAGSVVSYDSNGNPINPVFWIGLAMVNLRSPNPENLAATGQPALEVARSLGGTPQSQTPFTSEKQFDPNLGIIANPYDLGWNYQSFGIWNMPGTGGGSIGATSFGAATPGPAVPTSGSATFTGKLAALYVSPAGIGSIAAANLAVNADFGNRVLSLSSSGTSLTRDLATATSASNLNLSGTLTYAPGSAAFSGTLISSGGTLSGTSNGKFYGASTQELGGSFTLRSATTAESLVGAYGAKR